jgi:hypothetical protein
LFLKRFDNLFSNALHEQNATLYQNRYHKLPSKYNELVSLINLSPHGKRESIRRGMRRFLSDGLQSVCNHLRQEFGGSRRERFSFEECFETSLPFTHRFLQLARYGFKLMQRDYYGTKLSKIAKKHFHAIAPQETVCCILHFFLNFFFDCYETET